MSPTDEPVHLRAAPVGQPSGPLVGTRVVELAGIGPAPFAAMLLGDLGADVVRVDRPVASEVGLDPRFDVTNRNKRSVVVDLKSSDGPGTVLALAARADIVIEGYRPGVAERLGVGPEHCRAVNPALVYGRMTGWGQDGPLAERAGHDIGYIATAGLLGMIGAPDGPPSIPANLLGDYAGGSLYLVVGVLAALLKARVAGAGQVVDAAIVDGAAHLTSVVQGMLAAGTWRDRRGHNFLDGACPYYAVYETGDGGWMAVGALEPKFYDVFVNVLGLVPGELPDRADERNWPALRGLFARRFKTAGRDEWAALFEGTDACTAPVLSLGEAARHPHLSHRDTYTESGGIAQPAPAPRFSATPGSLRRPPALPGAHNAEVARDWHVAALHPTASGATAETATATPPGPNYRKGKG